MTKPFSNLTKKLSPERHERVLRRTAELAKEMALQELRQALALTQQQIAGTMKMNQAAVSKLEHQSDMYISTLRRFLSAMGGDLRIVASFPEGEVIIKQFEDVRPAEPVEVHA